MCAATNATHEATRAFVNLLESWTPVTTNGVAVKEELFAQVTNSVPGWRTAYETTTFENKIDEAVKLEDLAALYPQRVMERGETNDYLTVAYVATRWDERVKGEFYKAVATFEKEILASIMRRRGRPNIEDSDMDRMRAHAAADYHLASVIVILSARIPWKREKPWRNNPSDQRKPDDASVDMSGYRKIRTPSGIVPEVLGIMRDQYLKRFFGCFSNISVDDLIRHNGMCDPSVVILLQRDTGDIYSCPLDLHPFVIQDVNIVHRDPGQIFLPHGAVFFGIYL